jgi:hypothetical protein
MNNSSSSSSTTSSKQIHTHNKNENTADDTITINEKISLTKNQYEVLNMICKSYDKPTSEYMQQAVVHTMETDIEYGDFCDVLMDKLNGEDKKTKNNDPSSHAYDILNNDLDMLKKLQTK